MKFLKTFSLALVSALILTACDGKETPPEPPKPDNDTYTGTIWVARETDDQFVLVGLKIELDVNEDGTTADLKMVKVKFAERMPEMDITIPGVGLTRSDDGEWQLSGDGIVPIAAGGPFPQYTITRLEGTVSERGMNLEMICGTYPLEFISPSPAIEK